MTPLLLTISILMASPVLAATELTYTGTVSQVQRGREVPTKSFQVTVLLSSQIGFVVEEDGAGGWPWPGRFGKVSDSTSLQLLHDHAGTRYPVPLPDPVFRKPELLQEGESWKTKNRRYEVQGTKKVNGKPRRQVRVAGERGLQCTMWIDETTHQLISAEQRFFMGPGDQFKMKMQLESARQLTDDESLKTDNAFSALLSLQSSLERPADEHRAELTGKQIATVKKILGGIEQLSSETSLADLVVAIRRDVNSQTKRQSEVATLGKNLVGKLAPKFQLTDLAGQTLKIEEGKTSVLHFWSYNGDTLEEPYGQVAYLEFMNNKLQDKNVNVFGVAVNPQLGKDGERNSAIRSIRKMKDFMNLSYEITIDDGSLLNQFGDPRSVGAKLPLWIVISPEGKVAHYHAGFHKVDRRLGLKELTDVVLKQK